MPVAQSRRAGLWLPLACLLLAAVAALPRLAALDVPLTADEPLWFARSTAFAAALRDGRWGATYQTGHPGVTTMWIAALGVGPGRAADLRGAPLSLSSPDRRAAFVAARRALALVGSALVALVAFLVARVFDLQVGILAGLLLAFDPWSVALGRVLHLDGLLALLCLVAVMASLLRWWRRAGRGYLLLAGVAAGLAILTKSAALVLLPPMLG